MVVEIMFRQCHALIFVKHAGFLVIVKHHISESLRHRMLSRRC